MGLRLYKATLVIIVKFWNFNKELVFILHQERKDELMASVFHEERKEDVQKEGVKVDDMGAKIRELDTSEDQISDREDDLKYKEEYPKVVEKEKINVCIMGKKLLQKNKERGSKKSKKNRMNLEKK